MKQSLASLPLPLRNSLASGSVVEACVSLVRCSPWKSRSPLRPGRRRLAAAVLRPEALHAGPGLDQRAVDREVLVRQQRLDLGLGQHRAQELGRDLALEQPVAVLGEHRHVPDRIVDAEPDEPAEQQVVVELLHQLPLRAHRVERLQQQRPQQLLRRDRGPAVQRVELLELRRQRRQRGIDDRQDRPQRMIRRHPALAAHIAEQPFRPPIRPAHPPTPPQSHRERSNHGRAAETSPFFRSLLELLLANLGRVLSKDALIDRLCGLEEAVAPNAIELYVSRLRRKLDGSTMHIRTLRGMGYVAELASQH